ncbi:hypothetical protein PoB_007704400 [Plakobranchus ocellatus]|uniref:Uncharacterized protein n=1 Tax=Plakobranchus ocellatus TaxID=259542 RepID=A0AAV4E2Q4_9GAST|nr:hypothetical protein PoB_007704400 [Plakobranchus ocellatus]
MEANVHVETSGDATNCREFPMFAVPGNALTVDQTRPDSHRYAMWNTLKTDQGREFDLDTSRFDPSV